MFLQVKTGRVWTEDHFTPSLQRRLRFSDEVYSRAKSEYVGTEIEILPTTLEEATIHEDGFASMDEYYLWLDLRWF